MEKRRRSSAAAIAVIALGLAARSSGQSAATGDVKSAAVAGQPAAGAGLSAAVPAWDVVSVKQTQTGNCPEGSGMMVLRDGVHIFCLPLQAMVQIAFRISETSRVVGLPDWTRSGGGWNIDAKVAGEDVAAFGKLSVDDRNRMLQAMLADRFHLKAHFEKREMPVYDLVVAKGGPKLKEATAEEASRSMLRGAVPGKIECISQSLSSLPYFLNRELGRPTVDKTGLTGKYDFTLEYVPATKAASDETGGPSIFTAVEEQLGLKLVPAKEPMDVLVIDSMERPAEN